MILVALIIDFCIFVLCYSWILYGKNWRPVLTLFMFYILKLICQHLFIAKYPESMIWEYPGFPSFAVSYYKNTDMFYAGNIGLLLICGIELWNFDFKIISGVAIVGIIFNFSLMVILRVNYFIDLFSGLIAAHYFHVMSTHFHKYLSKVVSLEKEDVENETPNYADENLKNNFMDDSVNSKNEKTENLNKSIASSTEENLK